MCQNVVFMISFSHTGIGLHRPWKVLALVSPTCLAQDTQG